LQPEETWLSVAMPVHCGERWLAATLASVAQQDCAGIEFILIDSGPDRQCETIVARFADRLNIRYQYRPDIKPWPSKTNLAVEQARGAHVAILHQDDLWGKERVSAIRKSIAAAPDAVLLLNPSFIVDENGKRLGLWRCPLSYNRLLDGRKVAQRLLVQNFISMPAPVIQREAWLECGGMDEALWYTADWDLYLKLLSRGPAFYAKAPSTAFRIHASSLTVSGSRERSDFRKQMQVVFERHSAMVPAAKLQQIKRRATASIAVNCALAGAMGGNRRLLAGALASVLRLGPAGVLCYVRDSRIVERSLPRLRARFAGGF
jgi:glycosyltransferase involved in cell wall biosynthesis